MSSHEFITERLQLAIYLHATNGLPFSRCRTSGGGKVQFVFCDPDQLGCELELAFDRGAYTRAIDIFASQKFIRRKMSEAIEKQTINKGAAENGFLSSRN